MSIHLDFETFSEADLRKVGAHKYAAHESTRILSLAYQTSKMHEPVLWVPGDPMPVAFKTSVSRKAIWEAFNAEFEMVIWDWVLHKKMGWGKCPHERQWRDVAAVSRYYALPGSLEKSAEALDSPFPKDDAGHRIMMKLSRPRKPSATNPDTCWTPESKPEDFAMLYEYNLQDVRAEKWISDELGYLPKREQKIWELNIRLNRRGAPVDVELSRTILKIKDIHLEKCNEEIFRLSGGVISKTTQTARISQFCGVTTLARDYLEAAIPKVKSTLHRRILTLRLQGARSSTAKFDAILGAAMENACIRGMFLYHSASTGRFSGGIVQPHNLPRPKLSGKEIKVALAVLKSGMSLPGKYNRLAKSGDLMTIFASLIRSAICAYEDYVIAIMDFSSIEARVLAWLAGELGALQLYRDGEDSYVHMAAYVYSVPVEDVTKDQRALGKAIILGAGYSMSAKTFKATCDSWGIDITDKLAEDAITAYRERHPKIKAFWYALNGACLEAIKTGRPQRLGNVVCNTVTKPFRALVITLPNGKKLFYPYARIKRIQAPWDPRLTNKTFYEDGVEYYLAKEKYRTKYDSKKFIIDSIFYKSMDAKTFRFIDTNTYGGKLVENVTQAVARELLCDALLEIDRHNIPIIMHVHDEVVCHVPESDGDRSIALMERAMSAPPKWAKTLPLAADGGLGLRYRK